VILAGHDNDSPTLDPTGDGWPRLFLQHAIQELEQRLRWLSCLADPAEERFHMTDEQKPILSYAPPAKKPRGSMVDTYIGIALWFIVVAILIIGAILIAALIGVLLNGIGPND
jgi:hypothetical protein